jgi:glycosyltransferase involved in cell wall biosynthesis
MPKNLELMKKLNLNPDNIIIGFSGHITEEKGLDILSYAARIVVRKYRNVRFLVIGDGPARLKYEMLVSKLGLSNFFTFTGFINADAVAEHLALTDIFVAPYRMLEFQKLMQIETPLKVVQYLAMGKPVVMSRISEQNVVSCSGGGLLTEPDHPRKLAEALMTLINDEEERKVMGKKARAYVERNLDWRLIAQNLIGIYRDLL